VTSWPERAQHDASLRAYVASEIAKAWIDVQALKVELEHRNEVIRSQKQRIAELEQDRKRKG